MSMFDILRIENQRGGEVVCVGGSWKTPGGERS
jgi:hypothetical protein